MRTAIINGVVITPTRRLNNVCVLIEDKKIVKITDHCTADEYIDAKGSYVTPGFIDLHTHGAGGYDFMDGTADAIIKACHTHMMHGTTAICPTTLTSTNEDLYNFFNCYKQAKKTMKNGPELLGIHMEGPYFSLEQRGAQDPKYIKTPKQEEYFEMLSKSDSIIRMSAAPELDGALELGRELRSRGILPSIGHSDAVFQTVSEAYDCGYTHITHLYSGMSTIRRINAYRHLGVVESAYLIDGMTVEIIADGKHLPPELLRLILKCKPIDKICLITDSMRGAGMADGQTVILGSLANGQECLIDNGVAVLPDRSAFAGSVCTADRCIRTMYKLAGAALEDAVTMMTLNPAKVLKIENRKGIIAPGMDADICIFNDDIKIQKVMVSGKVTYSI